MNAPRKRRQGKGQRGRKKDVEHVSVTISIGVAESGPELDSPDQVMKAADTALYKAKSRGRNRVCK